MMWTTSKELQGQLLRLWERGELLRDVITGNARFPLHIKLRTPSSGDITDHFDAVRAWASELATIDWLHIDWQEIRHRIQGMQKLPGSVWIASIEDALRAIGKLSEWRQFLTQAAITRETCAALLPWLEKRPLQAIALASEWQRLLAIVVWLINHPRPGIYLRQLDLPGVHSKFIETYRGILSELFDLVLPADAIDATKVGTSQFACRYGFLRKPTRIRFRVVDPMIQAAPGWVCPDITLDSENFSRLQLAVKRVFITENEINFLAFPRTQGAIIIFGAGYGWEGLANSNWLKNCAIYYWGDIDTHGFCILDQLRGYFGHVDSFLMDRETLEAHAPMWGNEDKPSRINLLRLTAEERKLYDDLRDNRIRANLRLEQEYITFQWLDGRLQQLSLK